MRFETRPGEQAQMDWGSSQVWLGEQGLRVRFFVMTLGYSRRMFVQAYPNERLGALLLARKRPLPSLGASRKRFSTTTRRRW